MNYNPMVTRTSVTSHSELANLSYTHAGGSGFTAGVKRTAEEAGLKQEIDSESFISSDDDDPLTEEISNSFVSRAMNIPVSSTAVTMPNLPHLSHFPGMTPSISPLQSCVPNAPSSSTSSQPQPGKPANGKKTKGRVKIKMEFIDNKLRRYTTFSKRKTGIMKKAYELSTLTGTQVMLLVASETGHVYTFATRKLQPMITSEAGKALIQTCLNSPDPPLGPGATNDQRMTPSGYEETELSYNISAEEEQKYMTGSPAGSPVSSCSGGSPSQESPKPLSSPSTERLQPESPVPPTLMPKGLGGISARSSANGDSSSPRILVPSPQQGLTGLTKAGNSANGETSLPRILVPSSREGLAVLSSASPIGASSPVMYQTAQGVVYAVPSPNQRAEGVLLNLGPYLATQPGSSSSKGSSSLSRNLIPITIPLTGGANSTTPTTHTATSNSHHHHQAKSRK